MKNLMKAVIVCLFSIMAVTTVYLTIQTEDMDYNGVQFGYGTTGTKYAFSDYKSQEWQREIERVRKQQEEGEQAEVIKQVPLEISSEVTSGIKFTPIDISGHRHVAWNQYNYGDSIKINSSTTLRNAGCGWCSLSSAMVELNPTKCGGMTPVDWINIMPKSVKDCWEGSMKHGAPQAWVNAVNSMGSYGQYRIIASAGKPTSACMDLIKRYAADKDKVIVVSTGFGEEPGIRVKKDGTKVSVSSINCLFTYGGHIICVTDLSDDGKSFHVDDSSTVAMNRLNDKGVGSFTYDKMCSLNFPIDDVGYGGFKYEMKACWVIQILSE